MIKVTGAFRQAYTSKKNKSRIVDLLAVGAVLWVTPILSAYTNLGSFEISGILIKKYSIKGLNQI